MCDQQCCAPLRANERCPNVIACGSRFHCQTHYATARTLYRQYKDVCDLAEKCDLTRIFGPSETAKEITFLNECYRLFIKAYDGRMKHRKYAFCPETWDEGHQTQFRLLKTRIETCETRLDILYEQQKQQFEQLEKQKKQSLMTLTAHKKVDTDEEDDEPEKKKDEKTDTRKVPTVSFRNVMKFRRRRLADDAEVDRLLKNYIKQNEIIIAERQKMFRLAMSVLRSLIPQLDNRDSKYLTDGDDIDNGTDDDEDDYNGDDDDGDDYDYDSELEYDSEDVEEYQNEYFQLVGSYHLARKLFEIGYLEPDYTPRKCSGCNCGRFASEYMKLACGCVFKQLCLGVYLKRMTIDSLKNMTTILLKHKARLQPLINDYLFALKIYGPQVLIMKTELEWSVQLNRLKFKDDVDSTEPITSKWMAQFRKPGLHKKLKSKKKSKTKTKTKTKTIALKTDDTVTDTATALAIIKI